MRRRLITAAGTGLAAATALSSLGLSGAATASGEHVDARQPSAKTPPKHAVARGTGGAVVSVDANATAVGLRVLKKGGTAADAAVATAAALGVTEPYSAGIGGGGYFVYYDAATQQVSTIDGRETAPRSISHDAFIDPETGDPYTFFPDLVTSGVSVGVPGTPALWDTVTQRWGYRTLGQNLRPAARLADHGFEVDKTFNLQTRENADRFAQLRSTRALYLRDGHAPRVGTTFRNPDLAATYRLLAERGTAALYDGALGREIVQAVQDPPTVKHPDLPVMPGTMTRADLRRYEAITRDPTTMTYRGITVAGMAPSSSGGTTVGEALNILENYDLGSLPRDEALHLYLEATALAFADRGAYVGDPAQVDVPTTELLSQGFADERACAIDESVAAVKPVPAGEPDGAYDTSCTTGVAAETRPDTEGLSTTHLVVVDKWGDVASYTLTIEQTGGSGIVVPGRGFLLNNELTDFTAVYDADDPNRIEGDKRPRSSMSPTILLRGGQPLMAIGSPGGSTIITTVLQTIINQVDFGMSLPEAVNAPRASQRNTADVTAEQSFIDEYGDALGLFGHTFVPAGDPGTSAAEIGAVTAIRLSNTGQLLAVAEKTRRGGGAAAVVDPK